MIIKTISTLGQFRDAFVSSGRKDQFSCDALGLLFSYFDDIEEPVELDVIGICCDFRESDAEEIRSDYDLSAGDDVGEYLNENTCVIGQTDDGAYVFQQF